MTIMVKPIMMTMLMTIALMLRMDDGHRPRFINYTPCSRHRRAPRCRSSCSYMSSYTALKLMSDGSLIDKNAVDPKVVSQYCVDDCV